MGKCVVFSSRRVVQTSAGLEEKWRMAERREGDLRKEGRECGLQTAEPLLRNCNSSGPPWAR